MNPTPVVLVRSTPTPTSTTKPGQATTYGPVFFVLAAVVVGALLISAWRLRRRVRGSET
jgi:hypothetical protein